MATTHLPLDGLLALDLSQFLAGPYASLRFQDQGARAIKIERPDGGDLSRSLYLSDTMVDGESTIFHAINRGKESLALNLKDADDLAALKTLIGKADVLIQNFRPPLSMLRCPATAPMDPGSKFPARTCWLRRGLV